MAQIVRYHIWESQLANQDITDKIVVRNLQATANAGIDAWGRKREQPILVTVTVSLGQSFSSAAAADSLDNSTIHYGILSKKIRSAINSIPPQDHLQTDALAMLIDDEVRQVAGKTPLASTEVDIFYPKASRYGDGAGFRYSISYLHAPFSMVLYLQNLRVDCIIGINSNEKIQKQPVVVNLWVDAVRSGRADDYARIESVVVEVGTFSECKTETDCV